MSLVLNNKLSLLQHQQQQITAQHPQLAPFKTDVVSEVVNILKDDLPNALPSVPPQQQTTYPSCFGLPYQDHNYGAPPPASPPVSPLQAPVQSQQVAPAHTPPLTRVNGHIDIEDVSAHTEICTSAPGGVSAAASTVLLPAPKSQLGPMLPPANIEVDDDDDDEDDDDHVDDSITRCICQFTHDDGYMICCDRCSVWQHVECMGVDKNDIPDNYLCERCQPRRVDKKKAVELQKRRRKELAAIDMLDSSGTETEDETIRLGINIGPFGRNKNKRKKKELKQTNKVGKGKLLKKDKKDKRKEKISLMSNARKKWAALNGKFTNRKPLGRKTRPAVQAISDNHTKWKKFAFSGSSNESYEEAGSNHYTPQFEAMLANKRLNGQQNFGATRSEQQLQVQLCKVAQVTPNSKGLEATEDMITSQPIIEYKGKVMLREQYDQENVFSKNGIPYVLFYSKLPNLEVCVDATTFANQARYVRRSCTPNAEIRHLVVGSKVRFFVVSQKAICEGAEVTIPFDYSYQKLESGVECACTRAACPVSKFFKKEEKKREKRGPKKRNNSKSEDSIPDVVEPSNKKPLIQSPPAKRQKTQSVDDEIKERVKMTSPIARRRRSSAVQEGSSIKSPQAKLNDSGNASSTDSPNEDKDKKLLTREERKMEAIMKAIEKMEKRDVRRKEAQARGSTCSTPSRGNSTDTKPIEVKEELEVEIAKPEKPLMPKTPQKEPKLEVKEPVDETVEEQPKMDVISVDPLNKLKGKGRRRKSTALRRRTRISSSPNITCNLTEAASSAEEGSLLATPSNSHSSVAEVNTPVSASSLSSAATAKGFKFPKTKKHLLNEWFNEKSQDLSRPLTIKTELADDNGPSSSNADTPEDCADFVKCVPSPLAGSLSHLRRSSMSGNTGVKALATNAAALASNSKPDTSLGSAKKRWLRQAMFESQPSSEATSPIPSGSNSPNPNIYAGSPSHSPPIDFVTPLKKRRFARESLGLEGSPFAINPSSVAANEVGNNLSAAGSSPEQGVNTDDESMPPPAISSCQESSTPPLPNGFKSPSTVSTTANAMQKILPESCRDLSADVSSSSNGREDQSQIALNDQDPNEASALPEQSFSISHATNPGLEQSRSRIARYSAFIPSSTQRRSQRKALEDGEIGDTDESLENIDTTLRLSDISSDTIDSGVDSSQVRSGSSSDNMDNTNCASSCASLREEFLSSDQVVSSSELSQTNPSAYGLETAQSSSQAEDVRLRRTSELEEGELSSSEEDEEQVEKLISDSASSSSKVQHHPDEPTAAPASSTLCSTGASVTSSSGSNSNSKTETNVDGLVSPSTMPSAVDSTSYRTFANGLGPPFVCSSTTDESPDQLVSSVREQLEHASFQSDPVAAEVHASEAQASEEVHLSLLEARRTFSQMNKPPSLATSSLIGSSSLPSATIPPPPLTSPGAMSSNQATTENMQEISSSSLSVSTSLPPTSSPPVISSSALSPGAASSLSSSQSRKKVSLSEYRMRLKCKPKPNRTSLADEGKSMSSSTSSSGSSPYLSTMNSTRGSPSRAAPSPSSKLVDSKRSPRPIPTLATLPLFDASELKNKVNSKEDVDSRLSLDSKEGDVEDKSRLSPSSLSGIPPLSLTERLRREFGVDAGNSEEDEDEGREDSPPPPPPPPPKPRVLGKADAGNSLKYVMPCGKVLNNSSGLGHAVMTNGPASGLTPPSSSITSNGPTGQPPHLPAMMGVSGLVGVPRSILPPAPLSSSTNQVPGGLNLPSQQQQHQPALPVSGTANQHQAGLPLQNGIPSLLALPIYKPSFTNNVDSTSPSLSSHPGKMSSVQPPSHNKTSTHNYNNNYNHH